MNTPESKAFHKMWVEMIQNSGPKNWSTYTWYQVGTDLGAGASATIFDADILGYFMDGGDNKEKGNLGFHAFAANPAAKAPTPNVWIWSLAMNAAGQAEGRRLVLDAMGVVDRARHVRRAQDGLRQSGSLLGLEGRGFREPPIDKSYTGYLAQYDASAPGSKSTSRRSRCSSTSRPSGRRRCRRWSPRKCRSTKVSTSSPPRSTSSSRTPASAEPDQTPRRRGASWARAPQIALGALNHRVRFRDRRRTLSCDRHAAVERADARRMARRFLPYLLEPAGAARLHRHPDSRSSPRSIIRCCAIASTCRRCRGSSGSATTSPFFSDAEFWNTVRVSLEYTALTVGVELVFGLAIALLLQKQTLSTTSLDPAAAAADDRAGDRRADVEADDQPQLRHPLLFRPAAGRAGFQVGVRPATARCSRSCWSTSGSIRRSS